MRSHIDKATNKTIILSSSFIIQFVSVVLIPHWCQVSLFTHASCHLFCLLTDLNLLNNFLVLFLTAHYFYCMYCMLNLTYSFVTHDTVLMFLEPWNIWSLDKSCWSQSVTWTLLFDSPEMKPCSSLSLVFFPCLHTS